MKLQKLVYVAYGWSTVWDRDFFQDGIEAWEHGPVIPSLFHEFKQFGNDPITAKALNFDQSSNIFTVPRVPKHDAEGMSILSLVHTAYGRVSASQLRNLTHAKGTPWYTVRHGEGGPAGSRQITRDSIRSHFLEKLKEYTGGE